MVLVHEDGSRTDAELWRDVLGDDFPDHLRALGGPGSGNFGHAGRPGEVGGSAGEGGGGTAVEEKKGKVARLDVKTFSERIEEAVFNDTGVTKEIMDHIVDTVPGNFEVRLHSGKDPDDGSPYVRMIMLGDNGAKVSNTFTRRPEGLEVHHDLLKLPIDLQAEGIGKDILRREIEDYQRLGVDHVSLLANIDVGGYAWAKYGFTLDPDNWDGTPDQFRSNLRQHFAAFDVPTDVRTKVLKVVDEHTDEDFLDPKVVWAISDLKEGDRKIGAEALLNFEWNGKLNMHDPETMARVRKYLAR